MFRESLGDLSTVNFDEKYDDDSIYDVPKLDLPLNTSLENINLIEITHKIVKLTISQHVMYTIQLHLSLSQKSDTSQQIDQYFTIFRRYRDFIWLQNQLENTYPGILLPPFPRKTAFENSKDSVIERRKRGFSRFLKRLCCHQELKSSYILYTFLSMPFIGDVQKATSSLASSHFVQPHIKWRIKIGLIRRRSYSYLVI
jgi:hypothetical protein